MKQKKSSSVNYYLLRTSTIFLVFWMSDFKNGNNNVYKYNILGLLDVAADKYNILGNKSTKKFSITTKFFSSLNRAVKSYTTNGFHFK